jgi:hypothetical protein
VVSSFAPFGNLQEDVVDPEELFVKHTVAEVRAVQRKLKWVLSSCRLTPHLTGCCAELKRTQSRRSFVSWLGALLDFPT